MPWFPQPGPQLAALEADFCDEIFYGGERGGGKSDFQLGYQEDGALRYGEHWRGIMFRKTYPELEELQSRAMEIFPGSGAIFKSQQSAGYAFSNSWYWPNGASVKMRYIENERDYGRYHGHQYTGISFDEVTEYATPSGLLRMLSTLRSAAGVPCTVRLTGNPGGIGHSWVKSRYIDVCPPRTPYRDPETGFTRMFIPSRLADNQILNANDPGYRNRILAATYGNEALRKAWTEGDWNIVAGAFFNCWSANMVLRPVALPEWWTRFRSGDWGSARPFSFGWWAIAGEDWQHPDGQIIPKGALIRYREYYGCEDPVKSPNVGLKIPAEDVARKILHLERGDKISYGVLDPAAFSSDGGPSIAERLYSGSGNILMFRPADNARVASKGAMGGWDQMRSRMLGLEGVPMIYCFDTCRDSIRTIPMLQHDENRIEDVNSDMEDHCFAAGTMAWTEDGPRPIETMVNGSVLTVGNRWAKYRSGRLVKSNAEVVRLKFDDGHSVTCTPDHKFLVDHDEWCYASELSGRKVLCAQEFLALPSKNSAVSDIIDAAPTSSEKEFVYTARFGKKPSGQSHPDFTPITRMRTERTILQKISNVFQKLPIWVVSMGRSLAGMESQQFQWQSLLPESGTFLLPVRNGIGSRGFGFADGNAAEQIGVVMSVGSHTKRPSISSQNSVTPTARPKLCVSVEKLNEKQDVYCITVPETGCFALANGMIVSNCGDDWRYACMSRPFVRPKPVENTKPRFLAEMTANELFFPKNGQRQRNSRI